MTNIETKIESIKGELQDLVEKYNGNITVYQDKVKEYQADLDGIQKTSQEIALQINRKEEALQTLIELQESNEPVKATSSKKK